METVRPLFTNTFDFCIDNFFSDNIQRDQVMGELLRYVHQPRDLPKPTECGKLKIRTKEWLPITNTIVYYWNLGRVWEVFGIVENDNDSQLDELNDLMTKQISK